MRFLLITSALVGMSFSQAHAAVSATLSGGENTILTLTLNQDVTFINVPAGLTQYGFVLLGAAAGNTDDAFSNNSSGTSSWTDDLGVNGGSGMVAGTNGTFGIADLTKQDVFFLWQTGEGQPATTSTMTLKAGTRISSTGIDATIPDGTGNFEVRMINSSFNFIGEAGTAVPEPSSAILLGAGALGLMIRRRR